MKGVEERDNAEDVSRMKGGGSMPTSCIPMAIGMRERGSPLVFGGGVYSIVHILSNYLF